MHIHTSLSLRFRQSSRLSRSIASQPSRKMQILTGPCRRAIFFFFFLKGSHTARARHYGNQRERDYKSPLSRIVVLFISMCTIMHNIFLFREFKRKKYNNFIYTNLLLTSTLKNLRRKYFLYTREKVNIYQAYYEYKKY